MRTTIGDLIETNERTEAVLGAIRMALEDHPGEDDADRISVTRLLLEEAEETLTFWSGMGMDAELVMGE